jgi:3-hydroxyisobutyrate dehydrogenase-like beta-hydroxyacid dehydrogenase
MWPPYTFMTIAMAFPVTAFEKLGLPVYVGRALLLGNSTLAIAGANDIVPEMARRAYGPGNFYIDNMILSINQAIAFAARLGINADVMSAIRDVYSRAVRIDQSNDPTQNRQPPSLATRGFIK